MGEKLGGMPTCLLCGHVLRAQPRPPEVFRGVGLGQSYNDTAGGGARGAIVFRYAARVPMATDTGDSVSNTIICEYQFGRMPSVSSFAGLIVGRGYFKAEFLGSLGLGLY